MFLVNLTFKRFPARTADSIYVRELSRGFAKHLKSNFLLVVGNDNSSELKDIPHHVIGFQVVRWRTLYYFFWIPFFFLFSLKRNSQVVFFSNDHFLLSSLVIWKKLFRFSYKVCADWHMLIDNWKDSFVAQNADIHITTTEHLRRQVIEKLSVNPKKIFTTHGGVVKSYMSQSFSVPEKRKELGLPTDSLLVSYVGFFKTLGMEKGITVMIDALKYISDYRIKMLFVGGSRDDIRHYTQYADRLDLKDRCIFVERVDSEQVMFYQMVSDILVIPYPNKPHFRDYGFPMKAYEYLASGIPIVYSKLAILDEVLSGYGFSFCPDDPSSLAQQIEIVLGLNKDEIAKKAYMYVKDLTWDHKAKNIIMNITRCLYEK